MEFRRATKADVEAFVDVRIEFVTQIRTIADVDDFRARTLEYLTDHIERDDLLVYLAVEDGEIIVDVYLMVRYGYVIPETARKVQDSVSAAVSGMTGYNVHAVNVHVGGISFN